MATVDNRLPEDFSRIAVPAKLVAPIPTGAPPNALTERSKRTFHAIKISILQFIKVFLLLLEFFSKLGQSYVVKAEPKSVHFAGFNVGETIVKELVSTIKWSIALKLHLLGTDII